MLKNLLIVVLGAGLLAALIVGRRDGPEPRTDPPPDPPPEEISPYAVFDTLIDAALAEVGMEGAAIGCCVIDEGGQVVFGRNARTAFIPASSLKTLTTATALEVLGADFRIETELRATAEPVDGVIDGDLLIVGGGDPMLSGADLQSMAEELRAVAGVRQVTGRAIGDGRLFEGSIYADFWNWGDIGNGYGSPVSGLNIDHNRFTATFRQGAGGIGDRAELARVEPEVPGVTFVNETRLAGAHSGDGVTIHGGERTGLIFFRGTVPANGLDLSVSGAVPDPERLAAHRFRQLFDVRGEAVCARSLGAVPEFAGGALVTHRSPPLREIVRSIHITSDNHETECIHRLLGMRAGVAPAEAIRAHWAARGLEFRGLRMEDGSGLARADFITPHDLAMLQHLAGTGPVSQVYKDSLPSRDDGALRWKGGAMSSVRSYAGYALGADGAERCFALIVNHYSDAAPVAELREALWAELRALRPDRP